MFTLLYRKGEEHIAMKSEDFNDCTDAAPDIVLGSLPEGSEGKNGNGVVDTCSYY